MNLSPEQIETLRKKLLGEKGSLVEKISKLSKNKDFGDDSDGFEEEADEAEEFGNILSVKNVLTDGLEKVEGALNKMKNGMFGICASCKKDIDFPLLEIDPSSELCRKCKISR